MCASKSWLRLMTSFVGTAVIALAVGYAARVVPHWFAPQGAGIDHWFWKNYVETYRRQRRFPPALTQYVLDQAQWYPPIFPLFLRRLPERILDRYSHHVAIVIDLIRMLLLMAVVAWETGGSQRSVLLAGLVYALTPIQVFYNIQLNPRALAALMLDVLLLGLLAWLQYGGGWAVWLAIAFVAALVLLTHKMTTQLFWFLMLVTGVLYRRWDVLLLIPASIAMALILSGGFYRKVLVAHWDIVSFWNRNWRWIGADPIRESPVYGDGQYERAEKLHKHGLRGVLWHLFILFGFSPAAWLSCLLAYERLSGASHFLIYPTYILVWLFATCAWAVMTSFAKPLRCLGAGYLYVYNSSFLCSLLLAVTFRYTRSPRFSTTFALIALGLNAVGVLLYYRYFVHNKRTRVDTGLDLMIGELRAREHGLVMCIPSNWHEVVAYKTGYPVLWGGHGYGFRLFEPIWPRLQLRLSDIIQKYGVRYLLTSDDMLVPAVERELADAVIVKHGEYRLYCLPISDASPAQSHV